MTTVGLREKGTKGGHKCLGKDSRGGRNNRGWGKPIRGINNGVGNSF